MDEYGFGNSLLNDFFDEMKALLENIWGNEWGSFGEYEGELESPEAISFPRICYQVNRRIPSQRSGPKPRYYGDEIDPNNPEFSVSVHRQWYDCEILFYVMDKNMGATRELTDAFDVFMTTWIGYFKELGISEIIFLEESLPKVEREHRQFVASRALVYKVSYERITRVHQKMLTEVLMKINNPKPEDEIRISK